MRCGCRIFFGVYTDVKKNFCRLTAKQSRARKKCISYSNGLLEYDSFSFFPTVYVHVHIFNRGYIIVYHAAKQFRLSELHINHMRTRVLRTMSYVHTNSASLSRCLVVIKIPCRPSRAAAALHSSRRSSRTTSFRFVVTVAFLLCAALSDRPFRVRYSITTAPAVRACAMRATRRVFTLNRNVYAWVPLRNGRNGHNFL